MNRKTAFISHVPASQPKPLTLAIRTLIAGGLAVSAGARNAHAELPVPLNASALTSQGQASATINGSNMTIKQLSDRATLEWQSFNIGSANSVNFQQPSSSSVALNNIHQADPSRIMGKLTANGQVYLVNQNGFVFGKDSQVNANSLVASSLGISQDVFERGITKVFDLDNSAALQGNGEIYVRNDHGDYLLDQNGNKIKIQIFITDGAKIKTESGGRVIIAAPVIDNQGTIETPDGQTILAAAQDKVYLQEAGGDANLRGLLVEVGKGGEVDNVGKVLAERGNASLIGFAVNQKGRVSATTSVQINGSVRLMAREGIQNPSSTGGKLLPQATSRGSDAGDGLGTEATVTLAGGSVTGVELDSDKTATAIDAQPQAKSQVEISGHNVVVKDQAVVRAKSGQIDIAAVDNPADPNLKGDARVYLQAGSSVDVSGVDNVSLPLERNVIEVELRKNELRDSPEQRDGVLYGQKVKVDLRDADLSYDQHSGELASASIPIADIKGAVDRIARNIDERSTAGGTINIASSGDVVTQNGSLLDFSGGSVAYRDGVIATTKLVSNGQIIDISQADPNRHYDGILGQVSQDSAKWGVTQNWQVSGLLTGRSEAGYVEGKAGGKLNIKSYEALLNGNLDGSTVAGIRQRQPEAQAPASAVTIDLSRGNLFGKQDVVFGRNTSAAIPGIDEAIARKAVGSKQAAALTLDPALFNNAGVGNVSVKTNGSVRLDAGETLTLPESGSLSLAAAGADIQGAIVAPAGNVSIQPVVGAGSPLANPITLGSAASIDVRGVWLNDWLTAQQGKPVQGNAAIDGGSVSLHTERGDLTLAQGSRIDVSSGAWLQSGGELQAGKAGAISLIAETRVNGGKPSSLLLDGQLAGWGISNGGRLNLVSNEVLIGAASDFSPRSDSSAQPLLLSANFFQQGGFADYQVGANVYGLTVADGVQLQPQQRNAQLNSRAGTTASGANLSSISDITTLPASVRQATNLQLSAQGTLAQKRDAVLRIGNNASIRTDREGSVTLNSDTSVLIDGSIDAPAGTINVNITTPGNGDSGYFAEQGIWLGANSRLAAQGAFKPQANLYGLTMGDVLSGGSINLTANRGSIISYAGSQVDVSGSARNIDVLQGSASTVQAVSQTVASPGGSINLTAAEGIVTEGSFDARGGGNAAGGTLAIELNGGLRNKPEVPVARGGFPDDDNIAKPRSIEIGADPLSLLAFTPMGSPLADELNGRVLLNQAQLNDAGAASLKLKVDASAGKRYTGSIIFDGDVSLRAQRSIVLDAPTFKTVNGATVSLDTAYASLGSSKSRLDSALGQGRYASKLAPDAVGGDGRFTVDAGAIDLVGGLSFDGFNEVALNSRGDLRTVGIRTSRDSKNFLGELKLAGNLTIKADQIYPTTLSEYTITVGGKGSETVTLLPGGNNAGPVLSAAGSLTINAPNISQQGVLKAPFGALALNAANNLQLAAGSVTSVSGAGLTVPFGQVSGGLNWLYPLDATGSVNLLLETPPEKRLSLNGANVALDDGATVDLTGGGDLYAYEFIAGPGGSTDVLDPASAGYVEKFAVMPALGKALTPVDPLELPDSGLEVGDSVYLNGGGGLDAGWYTLLPAHYALLPGAFLVTPQANSQDMLPGQSYTTYTGATIVAGRYGVADAGIADARWQGFAVERGSAARSRSEFKDYSANSFFAANMAAQRPDDAGRLSVEVANSLSLHAELRAASANNGCGGQVDIGADHLAIVGRREELLGMPEGTVAVLDDDLNTLNAPSLLLGGLRGKADNGQRLAVSAESLHISGSTQLSGQEILLAAKDSLQLASGAVVESSGRSGAAADDLYVANDSGGSDGALLRVSNANQVRVIRDQNVTGNRGVLTVEDGVRLAAGGSMLLDSTQNTVFDGTIDMQGGALALKSSRISLGNAPANTPGLVLANSAFNLDELLLASAGDLDIYGGVSLDSKQLTIDAAQINGYDNAGATATLHADTLRLLNDGVMSDRSGSGTGSGNLAIAAGTVELGSGDYAIGGFGQVTIDATQAVKGLGQSFAADSGDSQLAAAGSLRVDSNLTVNAGHFTGANGATTTLDVGNHALVLNSPASVDPNRSSGLGVRWTVNAGSISGNGRFDLPAGIIELNASTGDITLADGSFIDVAGRDIVMAGNHNYAPAGSVYLNAAQGSVVLAGGAAIDLSASHSGGLLSIAAPNGSFAWNGNIDAGSTQQGRLLLDVAELGEAGFSGFNTKFTAAGFGQQLGLTLRNGDLSIAEGDQLIAGDINLAVLQGLANIAGSLDTGGASDGSVSVYGRDGIVLASTGKIHAADGSVTLDTVHRDNNGSGLLDLSASGGIDVSGSTGSGSIHLRTGRDTQNRVAVTAINSHIVAGDDSRATLEATRVYDGVSNISTSNIAGWKADTTGFMTAAASAYAGSPLQLLPGLEIRGSGNLTLGNRWDLLDWRYTDSNGDNTLPGYLTLNAGSNLNIKASLTDALATDALPGQDGRNYQDMIQAGRSWSYQLIAGGNVELAASQVAVRTGTGSISVEAGDNIRFVADSKNSSSAAAIYTVGTVAAYTRNQLLQGLVPGAPARLVGESDSAYINRLDEESMNQLLRFGYLDETRIGTLFQKAEFPTQGGAISLKAGGDIDGVKTGQKISDWLVRSGTLAENNRATLWGINISGDRGTASGKGIRNFNQNIGTLGGGDVTIAAGGNIRNLSAMLPTTGKPFGTVSDTANQWLANSTVVNGGGDLRISAGGNIVGGEYYVGRGSAALAAGGSIGASSGNSVFELGDGSVDVRARQDVGIAGVYNPTALKQTQLVGGESRFFSYGSNSAAHFLSTAGNINFENNAGLSFEYAVYPGTVTAQALSGDIAIDQSMTLFPDTDGQLALFANNNIRSATQAGQTIAINVSDADPSLLPDSRTAAPSLEGSLYDGLIRARERLDPLTADAGVIHAVTPLHIDDKQKALVVANLGNIAFAPGSQVGFYLPKAAEFVAGTDIRNLSLLAQNLSADDVSRVEAGRDIVFDTQISGNGVVQSNDNALLVGGSGLLQVLAGRNINLGSAAGISTIGNIVNTALGDGAGIDIVTGLAGQTDVAGFAAQYAAKPEYQALLQDLASQGDERNQLTTVLKVLFKEIQQAASAAAAAPEASRAALYQRGFDAIAALFPADSYHGDLSLVFSQIKTLDGGGIQLAVPGGKVDVGLAGQLAGISKTADQLGIVVQQQGDLSAFAEGNFNVNQSRVFTLAGGDITVWSSKGSIDAGKGAKSAIAAPPPVTMVDENGNIVTLFPPIVSGSGIQAVGDGLVTLAAPEGIVDAGEAGISGGQIVIAATAVVGASNIQASGGTVGVPTSVAPVVNVSGADSAATNAAKSATQMSDASNNAGSGKDAGDRAVAAISMLNADVVGYGDCSEADVRDGKAGCGG